MHSAHILEIKGTGLVFTLFLPYVLNKTMQVVKNNLEMKERDIAICVTLHSGDVLGCMFAFATSWGFLYLPDKTNNVVNQLSSQRWTC